MTALLRLSAGLIVWAAGFCLVYALHGIGCANGWASRTVGGVGLHQAALAIAWIGTVAATAAIAGWSLRHRTGALGDAAVWANGAAVVAAAVTFIPILAVPPCL